MPLKKKNQNMKPTFVMFSVLFIFFIVPLFDCLELHVAYLIYNTYFIHLLGASQFSL